jgi:hypothetical protein
MNKKLAEWQVVTYELVEEFVKLYFTYEDGSRPDWRWVGDDIGGIVDINDWYLFDLDRIVEAIKYNCSKKILLHYYEDLMDLEGKKLGVNFKNYIKFYPKFCLKK